MQGLPSRQDRFFPDFPKIDQFVNGKQTYLSFEEMQLKSPETAELVDRMFTRDETAAVLEETRQRADKTLKSSNELTSVFGWEMSQKIETALDLVSKTPMLA